MKTFTATPATIEHRWWLVDAEGQSLGRLASHVAQLIRGKHKPTFTPHMDGGDFVIVVNAAKVRLTGRKLEQKRYFRHTGYVGHAKFTSVAVMLEKHPERVIQRAVWGMLPKSTLGRQKLRRKLKVYTGSTHPHAAQQPQPYELVRGAP
jgi:large subunit ribosomal protein L13